MCIRHEEKIKLHYSVEPRELTVLERVSFGLN